MNKNLEFEFLINGNLATIGDKTPTRTQLLVEAGFEPAEDYGLIRRTKHGTKVISSGDVLELEGEDEFFAFTGGSMFELTVNGHSIVWGDEKIEIEALRRLANVHEEYELLWERVDEADEVLPLHGQFELRSNGIEHLKTRKHAKPHYQFFVESDKFTTDQDSLTGAQIMAMVPEWDAANSLVLEGEGSNPDEVIHPTTTITFKGRHGTAHFSIVPPATFGVV
jgi:Multiubiquitin